MILRLATSHTDHFVVSHDSSMTVMSIVMAAMIVLDVAMLYSHVAMHRRIVALEAELAAKK
jgi:hypothetical protein